MILSKAIVSTWGLLIEISIWLVLFAATVAGYQAGDFIGAVLGIFTAFMGMSFFVGAFLVLEDIRRIQNATYETLKGIQDKL